MKIIYRLFLSKNVRIVANYNVHIHFFYLLKHNYIKTFSSSTKYKLSYTAVLIKIYILKYITYISKLSDSNDLKNKMDKF